MRSTSVNVLGMVLSGKLCFFRIVILGNVKDPPSGGEAIPLLFFLSAGNSGCGGTGFSLGLNDVVGLSSSSNLAIWFSSEVESRGVTFCTTAIPKTGSGDIVFLSRCCKREGVREGETDGDIDAATDGFLEWVATS